MSESTAQLKNYRQSPRKVRLVADLIRGKSAARALDLLGALPKRASGPVATLLRSAIANAKSSGMEADELYVSRVEVNQGLVFKRSMPRARGRASMIKKKTSHITLGLSKKALKAKKAAPAKEPAAQ